MFTWTKNRCTNKIILTGDGIFKHDSTNIQVYQVPLYKFNNKLLISKEIIYWQIHTNVFTIINWSTADTNQAGDNMENIAPTYIFISVFDE